MTKISRRALMAGAVNAATSGRGDLSPLAAAAPLRGASDGVAAKASTWIAANDRLTAMQMEWQAQESLLFEKAKRMKIGCARASHSNMPEARAMRMLDAQIRGTLDQMETSAAEISLISSTTIEGALAKIELGLKVQGPFDWRASALELVEDGIAELRVMMLGAAGAELSSFR